MKNIVILVISVVVLLIIFIIIVLIVGKNKIRSILTPLDISKKDINDYLKQKYKVYKEMIKYIKDNLSIKEEAFNEFCIVSVEIPNKLASLFISVVSFIFPGTNPT